MNHLGASEKPWDIKARFTFLVEIQICKLDIFPTPSDIIGHLVGLFRKSDGHGGI